MEKSKGGVGKIKSVFLENNQSVLTPRHLSDGKHPSTLDTGESPSNKSTSPNFNLQSEKSPIGERESSSHAKKNGLGGKTSEVCSEEHTPKSAQMLQMQEKLKFVFMHADHGSNESRISPEASRHHQTSHQCPQRHSKKTFTFPNSARGGAHSKHTSSSKQDESDQQTTLSPKSPKSKWLNRAPSGGNAGGSVFYTSVDKDNDGEESPSCTSQGLQQEECSKTPKEYSKSLMGCSKQPDECSKSPTLTSLSPPIPPPKPSKVASGTCVGSPVEQKVSALSPSPEATKVISIGRDCDQGSLSPASPTPLPSAPPPPPQSAKPTAASIPKRQHVKEVKPFRLPEKPEARPRPVLDSTGGGPSPAEWGTQRGTVFRRKEVIKRKSDIQHEDGEENVDDTVCLWLNAAVADDHRRFHPPSQSGDVVLREGGGGGDEVYENAEVGVRAGANNRHMWMRAPMRSMDEDEDDDEDYWEDSSFDEWTSDEEEPPSSMLDGVCLRGKSQEYTQRPKERSQSRASFINKAHQVANELYTSEKAYVSKLHLLHKFRLELLEHTTLLSTFSEDVIKQMFPSIESIYHFHNDTLLPEMEARITNWKNKSKIGDIMVGFSPFLKLYVEYMTKVDKALALITKFREKISNFDNLIKSTETRPEFGGLGITHHMLEPVQRVPRYRLLLEQYVKYLPDDSDDRQDAEKALKLICNIASGHNEALKMEEKARELWDIANLLDGTVDLLDRPRDLIKSGRLWEVSVHSGSRHKRMAFLFSDMLLVCARKPLLWYEVRVKFDFDDMEVRDSANPETESGFIIKSKTKVLELSCKSESDEKEWRDRLVSAKKNYKENHVLANRRDGEKNGQDKMVGEEAPIFVHFQAVSKCMQCSEEFTLLLRKKHCYACGIVVCWKCRVKQAPLSYKKNQQCGVCDKCFLDIRHDRTISLSRKLTYRVKQQVAADDPALLSGYVYISENARRTWNKMWLTLHTDYSLYIFKGHRDIETTHVLRVADCTVSLQKSRDRHALHALAITCAETDKTIYIKFNDETKLLKWLETLQLASKGELPQSPLEANDRILKTL